MGLPWGRVLLKFWEDMIKEGETRSSPGGVVGLLLIYLGSPVNDDTILSD